MPVLKLDQLIATQELLSIVHRLNDAAPGLVLSTGQSGSGKMTTLLAIALQLARPGQTVVLITEQKEDVAIFSPLPEKWRSVVVESTETSWRAALSGSDISDDAIVVVANLSLINNKAVVQVSARRWVLATVDTAMIGVDVAYPLYQMGISNETFTDLVRLVWSQLLVETLCTQCSAPAELTAAEVDYLFPTNLPGSGTRVEVGCPVCAKNSRSARGNAGRHAVCEAILIDDTSRPAIRHALLEGEPLVLTANWHVTVQDQARAAVASGLVGIGTYRDTIRRNPLLRAQNTIEREQSNAFKLGSLFDKFVSPEVKHRLLDSSRVNAVVSGESRDISCLFCDIRNFTARAEMRDPQTLFEELNRYFAEVVDAVFTHDGTIDKFIGDAVMVVFGAPTVQLDHAERAVACAVSIMQRIDTFNSSSSDDIPIAIGIGINSGKAMAGCIGTERRMEYTVLGDTVNIASRLESRALPGQILISGATKDSLSEAFRLNSVGSLELKGKAVHVDAFEVLR